MTVETKLSAPPGLKRRLADSWLHPLHIARRTLRRTLASARDDVRGLTLDVGCGGKRYATLFPHVSRFLFVDLPANSADEQAVSVWADGRRLPFRSASFDSVLCTQVLEHVPTPADIFLEAYRVLRDDGRLVLTTPQTWGLHEVPHDYYRYTEYGLRFLAENAGFRVVRIERTCGLWATVGQRTSSFLFFDLAADRNMIVRGAMAALCAGLQLTASGLDSVFGHRGDPLDHLLVAVKPRANSVVKSGAIG